MMSLDFCNVIQNLPENIKLVESLTQNAKLNSEYEVHSHFKEFEIYWFIKGDLYFSVEGKRIEISDGDMIIICNNCLHRPIIKNQCLYHRKRILFSADLFSKSDLNSYELLYLLLKQKCFKINCERAKESGLDKLFDDIEKELKLKTPYNDFCAVITLYYFLIKAEKLSSCPEENQAIQSKKAYRVMEYIEQNISSKLTYQKISQEFNTSVKSLYKLFTEETGYSLGKYICVRRIVKAKALINSGMSASEAALLAGFEDYSVFYRSFVKEVGISPSKYQKEMRSLV